MINGEQIIVLTYVEILVFSLLLRTPISSGPRNGEQPKYQQTDSESKEDEQAERKTNQEVHWRTDREKETGPPPYNMGYPYDIR